MLLIASQGRDEYSPNFSVDAGDWDSFHNSATLGPHVESRPCEVLQPAEPAGKVGAGEGRGSRQAPTQGRHTPDLTFPGDEASRCP